MHFLLQQGIALDIETIALRTQTTQLILQLLDARALDLHGLVCSPELLIEALPLALPFSLRVLGGLEMTRGIALRMTRALDLGRKPRQLIANRDQLLLITSDLHRQRFERGA